MKSPGRPSSESRSAPMLPGDKLRPPPELDGDPEARRVFVELVAAALERHFTPLDVPLLTLFCRMRSQAEAATAEIARELPNPSPGLLQAQAQAVTACHNLSLRL